MSFLGDIASALGSLFGLNKDSCPTSLQPLVQWPGGKAKMAKRLASLFPKHDTYVEPFAGGAAVFFHKPLVKRNVISDVDPWIIGLYKDVRSGKLERCEDGIVASRSLFNRAKKNKSACHKVALSTLSYHGNREDFKGDKVHGAVMLKNRLAKQKCYADKLKRAIVLKKDFAEVMREYDSKSTLHFLDPPWPMEYSDKYHGSSKPKKGKSKDPKEFGGAMDPAHVRRVCDKMKGTVVVIYNWTPELQRTFSGPGWKTLKINAPTGGGFRGTVMKKNLVAIKRAK
jgi:DNA adenine methylase